MEMRKGDTDPEGRPVEDPSSTLAFAPVRDIQLVRSSTSVRDDATRSSTASHHDGDMEKGRDGSLELGQSGSGTDETRRTRPPDEEGLQRTATAIHGKDAQGRYIISWEGDGDPENPKNWPYRKKMINVAVISLMAFLTPLCSSIVAPGLPDIQEEFDCSATLASLSVSIFVIAFGIGPLVLAPISETIGRKWIYNICYPLFTVFQVGCALSTNIGMLIAFRLLAGLFGSAGLALGGGTISDMFNPRDRAKVVGKYVLGVLLGPIFGPIIGGFLVEVSWRWTFWLVTIVGGINSIVGLLFLRETYAPVLLKQRAERMAKELEHPTIAADHDPRSLERRLFQAIKRPGKILFLQPIVFIMAVYMALLYGTVYLLVTTFPTVWAERYGFNSGETGLTYIGLGIGYGLAISVGVPQIDRIYNKLADKNGGVGRPEYRIPVANVGAVLVPISLFWYGWSVERRDFWLVPIIGTVFFGLGLILIFNSIQNYYIDAFTRYAASAIAAGSVFRAIIGATFPLFAPQLYDALGYGWGTSVLAFAAVALMPMPLLIMRYGETIRTRFVINLD